MDRLSLTIVALTLPFILFLLSRRRSPHKPPIVPYWIPWVGSALDMAKDPDGFFHNAADKHGHVFTLKLFGQDITYVSSHSLISEVYRNPQKFDFSNPRMEFGARVFGFDRALAFSPFMQDKTFPAHRKYLSPQQIKPLLENYAKYCYKAVIESRDRFDGASAPLITFLIPLAYNTAAYAYFGRSFPAEKSYKPFKAFDDSFTLKAAGMPDFFLKKSIQAWDDVIGMVEDYLKTPHDESIEIVHILEQEGKSQGFTDRVIAQILASDLWALQANAIWAAYWVVVHQIQRPEGFSLLMNEADQAKKSWIADHPNDKFEDNISEFVTETHLPLLVSTIKESLRFSTFNQSIRDVQEPVELGGYKFDKGDRIVCSARAIHLDEEIHENAKSFVPDRYLNTKTFMKDGKPVHNHTIPFGGGVSQCEGRHFAMGELKIILFLLMLYTTIEMDSESEIPSFAMDRIGTGVLQPKGDLQVIIRKRYQ